MNSPAAYEATAWHPPQLDVEMKANTNLCSAKNNTYEIAVFEMSLFLERFLSLVILLL